MSIKKGGPNMDNFEKEVKVKEQQYFYKLEGKIVECLEELKIREAIVDYDAGDVFDLKYDIEIPKHIVMIEVIRILNDGRLKKIT